MFLLDSLMIAGIRWALETTITAAEAEMNDDTALREQLLEAEMRREMGEISDEEFARDRSRPAGAHPRDQGAARGRLGPAGLRRRAADGDLGGQPVPDRGQRVGRLPRPGRTPRTRPSSRPTPTARRRCSRPAAIAPIEVLDMQPGDAAERGRAGARRCRAFEAFEPFGTRTVRRSGRLERAERRERLEPSERPERPERLERFERLERVPNEIPLEVTPTLTYVYCLVRTARRPVVA